jgi:hypothetical protein
MVAGMSLVDPPPSVSFPSSKIVMGPTGAAMGHVGHGRCKGDRVFREADLTCASFRKTFGYSTTFCRSRESDPEANSAGNDLEYVA